MQRHLLIIHKQLMLSRKISKTKKRNVLIVFDDMITDMKANKKLKQIVADLFMRGRKRNILVVFVSQYYFKVPNDVRLNATHDFITKTPNKREIQQISLKHSSDIEFKDFMKLYKDYIKKTPFYF